MCDPGSPSALGRRSTQHLVGVPACVVSFGTLYPLAGSSLCIQVSQQLLLRVHNLVGGEHLLVDPNSPILPCVLQKCEDVTMAT